MSWKNFEAKKTKRAKIPKTTYSYKIQQKAILKAESGATYILQQLVFEFMKRATEYGESLKDKPKTDYILFGFEKTKAWEEYKEKNKEEIQRLKNLLKAHQYATK